MPEKPVECSHCQKPTQVTYKEMANNISSCTQMCSDCPILAKKLHGGIDSSIPKNNTFPLLHCALCMTTSETVQTGNPLGCNHCYVVFEDLLLEKFVSENTLSKSTIKEFLVSPSTSLHKGKSPNQAATNIPLSNELSSLAVALSDAIQKEHYEQAAWLRDQIKELKGEKQSD
jgi:protein arginine kinase activator